MKHHTSKLGILIIVIILGVVGVLIVTKTRSEKFAASTTSTIPVSSPEDIISEEEYIASSSDLSSPIPKPPAIDEYLYPKAQSLQTTASSLKFTTTDSAQAVTEWYKNKINSLEFNAKSSTQTNTNGATLNKITAAKPGENIEVTIKKDQTTSKVEITVDRS